MRGPVARNHACLTFTRLRGQQARRAARGARRAWRADWAALGRGSAASLTAA